MSPTQSLGQGPGRSRQTLGFGLSPSPQALREIQLTTLSCPSKEEAHPVPEPSTQQLAEAHSHPTAYASLAVSSHSHTHSPGHGAEAGSLSRPGASPGLGWVTATDSLAAEVPISPGCPQRDPQLVWGADLTGAVHARLLTIS